MVRNPQDPAQNETNKKSSEAKAFHHCSSFIHGDFHENGDHSYILSPPNMGMINNTLFVHMTLPLYVLFFCIHIFRYIFFGAKL